MGKRSILFSAPMVRAIREDRKTQTRRVVKGIAIDWLHPNGFTPEFVAHPDNGLCPYGQLGDTLRVKEAAWMWCERRPNGKTKNGRDKWLYVPMREAPIHYAADHPQRPSVAVVSPETGNLWCWRLKIGRFLPAWASRITLEVTGVRVERLQDISEADAQREGCGSTVDYSKGRAYRDEFRDLWQSIHGPGSWDANPWVWVVEFKRVKPK